MLVTTHHSRQRSFLLSRMPRFQFPTLRPAILTELLLGFLQYFLVSAGILSQIRPPHVTSTIQYNTIILPFNVTAATDCNIK